MISDTIFVLLFTHNVKSGLILRNRYYSTSRPGIEKHQDCAVKTGSILAKSKRMATPG